MQHSCYRCGAAVEDQAPFCSSCGAPQIRVNIEQEAPLAADTPATPPLEPGTPASVQPPATPVRFSQPDLVVPRKRFLRQIWPFALASGILLGLFWPLGLVFLPGSIIYCIHRYKRDHPGTFTRSDGARLGALTALLSFPPFGFLYALVIHQHPEVAREAFMRPLQQHAGQGPQYDAMLNFVSTQQGFITMVVISIIFFCLLMLALATVVGALSAGPRSDRRGI